MVLPSMKNCPHFKHRLRSSLPSKFVVVGRILITLLVCLATSQTFAKESDETLDVDSTQTGLPLEQIKNFAEIFTRIKRFYVEPVSDEKLLEYAVNGMLSGLDPHSVYLKGEHYDDLVTHRRQFPKPKPNRR